MGLLDNNYAPDPLAQGLLGLGSALMTPRQLGGGLMAGANAFNQGAMQAQMMRRQMAQDALRAKLIDAQLLETQAAGEQRRATLAAAEDERRRLREIQERQAGILGRIGAGGAPSFLDQSIAAGGRAPAGYVPPTGRPRITAADMAEWIAAGGDPKKLEAVAAAPDLGLPEVARVLERRGADNTPEQVREDRFGRQIGGVVPKPFEMRTVDIGGSVVPVNPFAPPTLTKTLTPGDLQQARDAAASRGVTIRGQNLADARAREATGAQLQIGAAGLAQKGWRYKEDGSLEPIPGGPADPTVKDPKQVQRAGDAVNRADIVIRKVDDALKKIGFTTTGATGAVLGKLPGTTAYDLRADAETIRANIGFQELQAMREASPTGGALGQVAVQELNALQSVVGNLDANQSERQLRANLTAVRRHFNNWKRAMQGQMPEGVPATQPDPLGVRAGAADPLGIR